VGKKITWSCDTCNRQGESYILPVGWLQCSYWNDRTNKWWRFDFCGYACLEKWAARQGKNYIRGGNCENYADKGNMRERRDNEKETENANRLHA